MAYVIKHGNAYLMRWSDMWPHAQSWEPSQSLAHRFEDRNQAVGVIADDRCRMPKGCRIVRLRGKGEVGT